MEEETAPTIEGVTAERDNLQSMIAVLDGEIASLGIPFDLSKSVTENAAAAIGSLHGKVEELETELGVLKTEKAALEGKLAAIDAAPKAKSHKAPKPRAIAPLDADAPSSHELLDLIRAAEHVEIAFSNGRREIADIPAREISGDAWAVTVAGVQLRGVDIELAGVGGAVDIAGYGLLLDGKLAAYRSRMEPLRVAPGAKVSLAGDIVF